MGIKLCSHTNSKIEVKREYILLIMFSSKWGSRFRASSEIRVPGRNYSSMSGHRAIIWAQFFMEYFFQDWENGPLSFLLFILLLATHYLNPSFVQDVGRKKIEGSFDRSSSIWGRESKCFTFQESFPQVLPLGRINLYWYVKIPPQSPL